MTIRKIAFPTIVALFLAVSITAHAATPTGGVIHFHDYLTGGTNDLNCTNDDTAELNQALADWITMQRSSPIGGGEFDAGAGCYKIAGPVQVGDNTGQGVKGDWHGAGPELTVFRWSGTRGIQFNDFWGGEIRDFTVQGPGRGTGQGLVFAALHNSLGTCCSSISNITSTDAGDCIDFGDPNSPNGSSADETVQNVSASRCTFGFHFGTWNTLDVHCIRCSVGDATTGFNNSMAVGGAGQLWFDGGGSSNTTTDFALYQDAQVINFRSEPPSGSTGPRFQLGGAGTKHLIQNYVAGTQTGTNASMTINSDSAVTVRGSKLPGPIVDSNTSPYGSVVSEQNSIWAPAGAKPVQAGANVKVYERADCVFNLTGTCTAWWPDLP